MQLRAQLLISRSLFGSSQISAVEPSLFAHARRCRVPSYPCLSHYADLLQGQPLSTSLSREEPALAPIEPVHQGIIMAAEVRANGDGAAPTASKTEWYAGATRFELELEV